MTPSSSSFAPESPRRSAGPLGRLEEVAQRLALLQEEAHPAINRKRLLIFAASHGAAVAAEGETPPGARTGERIRNFMAGGEAVNVLARQGGIGLRLIDTGVDDDFPPLEAPCFVSRSVRRGTRDFRQEPAMTAAEREAAMEAGREQIRIAAREGIQIAGIGEMGIGGDLASAALCTALGLLPAEPGTTPARLAPLGALETFGGYEMAAIAGAILEASARRLPVVIDGFVATASAAVAFALEPSSREVCFFAHCSREPKHRLLLGHLGVAPLFDLELEMGDGTGAALAIYLIESSARLMTEIRLR